jgi:lysophospholipase L1-like esterase
MPDTKITALNTSISGSGISYSDIWPFVDVSDTSMAASGTTKGATSRSLNSSVLGEIIDFEVVDYVQRIKIASGDIDGRTVFLFSQLVFEAKRDGWYNSVLEWYPMLGKDLTSALVKFKTVSGNQTTLTNNNLVAADYSQSRGIGPSSGNTNKSLRTGFIPANNGYSQTNFGLIASIVGRTTANAASSGVTIGDLVAANSGTCGIWLKHQTNNVIVGNGTYTGFQALNSCPKTISFQSSAARHQTCIDGVQMTDWVQATSGTLTGELALFSGIFSSATRYENGILGNVLFTSYMTESLAKLATASINKFERMVRSEFQYSENGLICWGDSITATQGASNWTLGFQSIVGRQLGLPVRNLGNSSQWLTASSGPIGATGQVADIAALPEKTVCLMFGTNDGQYGVTTGTYFSTLNSVVSTLTGALKRVIVCTPCFSTNSTYNTGVQRGFAQMCSLVATGINSILADTNRAIADQPNTGLYLADANHPNTSGHSIMADRILSAVYGFNERTLNMDFGSINGGTSEIQTVEILTAKPDCRVEVYPPTGINDGISVDAYVSAQNTVSVRAVNYTAGSINPASGLYTISVKNRL